MKAYYNIHSIWFVMMLLTISTYAMGKNGYDGIAVMLILLITSVIKGSFIIRDFMELHGVSLLWRALMYGWLWIICSAIAIAYMISI